MSTANNTKEKGEKKIKKNVWCDVPNCILGDDLSR